MLKYGLSKPIPIFNGKHKVSFLISGEKDGYHWDLRASIVGSESTPTVDKVIEFCSSFGAMRDSVLDRMA